MKNLNEKDTFIKVQEAILLTMKDQKLKSSLLNNASTDHYSDKEMGGPLDNKHKRMSEINRNIKETSTPNTAMRPIVTERL